MVRGVEKFKEYFKDYTGQYVFIGGAACDLLLGNLGLDFRATKDLDIVLLIDELNQDFADTFFQFVSDGGYEHIDRGNGKEQFYRFSKPADASFPYMIELFSRRPDYIKSLAVRLGAIHISDDALSLSAILLDDEYYRLLKEGMTVLDGVSLLDLEHIILFKIKAWLDLSDRKSVGEQIDTRDIKKHRNDIFRMVSNIENDAKLPLSGQIRADMDLFLERIQGEIIDLKGLKIRNATVDDLIERMRSCYKL